MWRPEADATIEARRIDGPLGLERIEYSWQPLWGEEVAGDIVRVDVHYTGDDVRPGQVFTIGPFRLRVLAEAWEWNGVIAMRDGWKARAYYVAYRLAGPLERMYRRLITTAAVWGWADWDQYRVPTWRDLRWPWKAKRR